MYEKWNAMDGWKNKIYSLVKGPGWRPGSPWTGFLDEVPDVNQSINNIRKALNKLGIYLMVPSTRHLDKAVKRLHNQGKPGIKRKVR